MSNEKLKEFWNHKLIETESGSVLAVSDVLLVVLVLIIGYLLSRFVQYLLVRRLASTSMRTDAVQVIQRVSSYVIYALIGLTTLNLLGIPITIFAFATGAIAIGVGFGAQNIINNFISGWILIAERPIRSGDFIEIDSAMGTVETVGTRSTRILRTDGVHMLVPNSKLLENTVINWTLIDRKIRTTLRVGVAYGSDIQLVSELMHKALDEHQDIIADPAPEVIFEDFGDNALVFDAYFWGDVAGEKSLRAIRSELRFTLNKLFIENDIVVAFPQRDIHLYADKPLKLEVSSNPKNDGASDSEKF